MRQLTRPVNLTRRVKAAQVSGRTLAGPCRKVKAIRVVVALAAVFGIALGIAEKLRWSYAILNDEVTVFACSAAAAALGAILSMFQRSRRTGVHILSFTPAAVVSYVATIFAFVGIWPWTNDAWVRFGQSRQRVIEVPWSDHAKFGSTQVAVHDRLESCGQKIRALGMRADTLKAEGPTSVRVYFTAARHPDDHSVPIVEVLTNGSAASKLATFQCGGTTVSTPNWFAWPWVAIIDNKSICDRVFISDVGPPTTWQEINIRCPGSK